MLFNRFYQPDLDIVALKVLTDRELSAPSEIRLPLLWLAVLRGRVKASLAATTGVATSDEVVKHPLAGGCGDGDVGIVSFEDLLHRPAQRAGPFGSVAKAHDDVGPVPHAEISGELPAQSCDPTS